RVPLSRLLAPRRLPRPPRFPYTPLFRSGVPEGDVGHPVAVVVARDREGVADAAVALVADRPDVGQFVQRPGHAAADGVARGVLRSEEHTSELQSRENLVCRLLLEKKKYT